MDDPHVTLGVPRGADTETIKAAFRLRALALHPDRVAAAGGDAVAAAAAFARVKAAYDALGGGGKVPSATAAAAATARAHAANPYARAWTGQGGRRPPPPPPPPRMRFGSLFRVIAARSTRGDAVAHAGMLSIALIGAALAAYGPGDAAWKRHNEGKLWDDVLAARREREHARKEGGA